MRLFTPDFTSKERESWKALNSIIEQLIIDRENEMKNENNNNNNNDTNNDDETKKNQSKNNNNMDKTLLKSKDTPTLYENIVQQIQNNKNGMFCTQSMTLYDTHKHTQKKRDNEPTLCKLQLLCVFVCNFQSTLFGCFFFGAFGVFATHFFKLFIFFYFF